MHKYLSLLIVILLSFGLVFNTAEAKRFGGGRSFGIQRSTSSFSRSHQPAANNLNPNRGGLMNNRWFGPIAGLITGGLLASLFMGNGIGSGIISWLLIGALALFVINLLKNRQRPSVINNPASSNYQNLNNNSQQYEPRGSFNENPFQRSQQTQTNYPAGFNADNFIRDAKVQFIRLQAAYDQKNLNDIRQFTTPEVFAEVQMQFNERGNESNHTEVVTLNAELLDATNENTSGMVATVKFTGLIKEEVGAVAVSLSEIWHFQQDPSTQSWLVAGIQQD